jgi:hypothetical protein
MSVASARAGWVVSDAKRRSHQSAALEILLLYGLLLLFLLSYVTYFLREEVAYYLDVRKMFRHLRMEIIPYTKTSFTLCR